MEKVDIVDIGCELKRLHKKIKEGGKVRACLFNMVVYVSESGRAETFKSLLDAVIQRYPCRIFFIENNRESAEDSLDVEVVSEGYATSKSSFVCDQIFIKVSGTMIERVPFLLTPHFVPDLPIFLLWGEDPTLEGGLLPSLEPYASRLIFDAESTSNLQRFAAVMQDKMKRVDYTIRDIHWGMTGPWRDAIAQIFDSHEAIEELRGAEELVITYKASDNTKPQHKEREALYLQAWLAAQLGWQECRATKESDATIALTYKNSGKERKILLRPASTPLFRQGAILSIDITCNEKLLYSLVRMDLLQKVSVHITRNDRCNLPFTVPLPNLQYGFSFMKEIFYEKTSIHYRNMLNLVRSVDWKEVFKE